MSEHNTFSLDLPERYLEQVRDLLRTHVPHAEVWAYGSRVSGGGHEASDLDLVLRNPANLREEAAGLFNLKEAFIESDCRSGLTSWTGHASPKVLRRDRAAKVVVQKGKR